MKVSDLGTRLTQAMSWRGMNGDDLARASGVHKSLICRYKKNEKEPREDRVDNELENTASVIDLTFGKYRNSM